MTIFQLECFSALAESLNFTHTANVMYITQPALSRTISSLEQELQLTLLQRTTHNVTLTPAGRVFAQECVRILDDFRRGTNRARSAQVGQIGSLQVGFQRDTFETFVVDCLNDFRTQHPDIALELFPFSPTTLLSSLGEHTVDAVIAGGMPPATTTQSLLIASRQECAVFPLDHPLAKRESVTMQELREEPFIVMSRSVSCGGYESVIQKALDAGFEARIVAQVDLVPTLMTLVACGQGISILHHDMAASVNGRLAFVPIRGVPLFRRWLMWDNANQNPCLQALIESVHGWQQRMELCE